MNIENFTEILINAGIDENEAKIELKMLLEHFCNFTDKDKIMGVQLDEEQVKILQDKIAERVNNRKPIQYIIGESYFMGEYYKVTPAVLIPRDETELLVRKAVEIINNDKLEDVLDIGTGSGCIACTIAKNTQSTVLGVDISTDALRIALDNVTRLGINNRAIFRKSNLFENIRAGEIFDLIISNPPYIPEGTILAPEVNHEPPAALYAKENGLEFYRKIIAQAPDYLADNGYLMFELGVGEADLVKNMMKKSFKNITVDRDLAGIERIIYAQKA